jgi:hypothetical protein
MSSLGAEIAFVPRPSMISRVMHSCEGVEKMSVTRQDNKNGAYRTGRKREFRQRADD